MTGKPGKVRTVAIVALAVIRGGIRVAWDWFVFTLALWLPPMLAMRWFGGSGFVLWFCLVGVARTKGFLRGRILGSHTAAAPADRVGGVRLADGDSGSPVSSDGSSSPRKPEAERLIRAVLTTPEQPGAVAKPAPAAPLVTPARSIVSRRRPKVA